ncbi:unnamed protein product [Effrenium voratum]|uniref:Uncharacterized protein n=1 Tax=Effrenium voratum TaxID=2562239 RepID=A0AA36I0E7_9DINO|nr:unnamed protein product [Effrenium voratum]CAJ1420109.1 unnamed protein product [Effrenium voratum]
MPRPVFASLAPLQTWRADEAPALPAVLNFRKLLEAQTEAENAPELPRAEEPRAKKAKLDAPEGLARIGSRDRLGEVIRSMENRLARQGILAAPETIIQRKKQKRDGDLFYDVSDNFIDDAQLAELNALEERRKPKAHASKAAASEADEGAEKAAVSAGPEMDVKAFRLTSAEVSGTESESESGEEELRDSRGWQWQLAELREELVLVSSKPLEGAGPELSPEESLEKIKDLLTELCSALNPEEQAKKQMQVLERALEDLHRRLPGLLRVTEADGELPTPRFSRWKLHKLEPQVSEEPGALSRRLKADVMPRGGPGEEEAFFAWSECEEVAWAWLLAAKAPQQEAFQATRDRLRATLQRCLREETSAVAVQAGIRRLHQESKKGHVVRLQGSGALKPLLPKLRLLQRLWLRRKLWQDQRQHGQVREAFPVDPRQEAMQQNAIAVFISEQLDDLAKIHLPKDLLVRQPRPWRKGGWAALRDGPVRNGLILRVLDKFCEMRFYGSVDERVARSLLRPVHLWRAGEAVEWQEDDGSWVPGTVSASVGKVDPKELGELPVAVSGDRSVPFAKIRRRDVAVKQEKQDTQEKKEPKAMDVIDVG